MTKDPLVYIDDIQKSIRRLEQYTADVQKDDFVDNDEKQDAVIRRLEVIGEAVKNLPEDLREQYDGVKWRQIAGMRDVLIHEYSGVQIERVWSVIEQDLPELKNQILTIKNDLEDQE